MCSHLLTHSSGLIYEIVSPLLQKWRAFRNESPTPGTTILEAYVTPLIYEPGTAWSYGPSLDFVGLMIERVSGSTLQDYFEKNFWPVLGIKDMTFHLKDGEDLRDRLTDMSARNPAGQAIYTPDCFSSENMVGNFGGIGLYSSAPDYFKVVLAVLQNDERLLKRATFDEMFRPQLSEAARGSLMETLAIPEMAALMGCLPAEINSLAGLLQLDDTLTRRKGTLTWGGAPNLIWVSTCFLDP